LGFGSIKKNLEKPVYFHFNRKW